MSKTRGNVVDPLGVIDDVGADALRFALVNGSAPGADQKLGMSRIEGARNFANKIWNAARFVLGARPAEVMAGEQLALPGADALGPAEHWILARTRATSAAVDSAFDAFQFGEAARLLHEAIWNDLCDWYLELAKLQLGADADPARRRATWQTLTWVLDRYLRLLHPVMPHLTEEVWGRLPHRSDDPSLLIVAPWPRPDDMPDIVDDAHATGVESIIELIRGIRNARAESGIEAAAVLDADVFLADASAAAAFPTLAPAIERMARVRVTLHADRGTFEASGTDDGSLAVLAAGLEARLARGDADLARERERLARELDEARGLLAGTEHKLANASFVERAPVAVVEAARTRAAELRERVERLTERLAG
jgi:valyl-tRNA synthetase